MAEVLTIAVSVAAVLLHPIPTQKLVSTLEHLAKTME
jgi:hypothetical protein